MSDPLLDELCASDLLLAVQRRRGGSIDAALAAGDDALWGERASSGPVDAPAAERDLDAAIARLPGANVAIVSVPGPFAALEAHKALRAGLDVLLFSDNVSLDEEIELKEHAAEVGRLVMGPGAGTAALGGCGLGFSNVVRRGRVGVVAAAGTGAQEAMSLLDRWGEGVTQVIGVGGRDLSTEVGGRMAALAVRALDRDPATEFILLVSKPPSPVAARAVVEAAGAHPDRRRAGRSGRERRHRRSHGRGADAWRAVCARCSPPWAFPCQRTAGGSGSDVEQALVGLDPTRTVVRGVYSGGTLCYEALTVLEPWLGPVWSNTPLDKRHRVPAPPGRHTCLDLGEEEYTQRAAASDDRPRGPAGGPARRGRGARRRRRAAGRGARVRLPSRPCGAAGAGLRGAGRARWPAVGRLPARDRRRSAGPLQAAGRVPGGRRPGGSDRRARCPGRGGRRPARRGHRGQFPPVTDPAP